MKPESPWDARPRPEDARPAVQDARPASWPASRGVASGSDSGAVRAAPGRRALDAVLLLAPICLFTAVTVPGLGVAIFVAAWGGGVGAALLALPVGLLVLTLLIALASHPGRRLIRSGDTWRSRLRWAAGVSLLGTLLVLAGGYLWHRDPGPFGSGPTRMWLVGLAYALAAAARSRPRVLRWVSLAGCGATAVLVLSLFAGSVSDRHQSTAGAAGIAGSQGAQAGRSVRIPSNLLFVGDTPAGYRPVASPVGDGDSGTSFVATYTCASNCPPDPSPGQAPSIIFTAEPTGPGEFSDHTALCGSNPAQGYVCSDLGPEMWRATVPSTPTINQVVIYEHGGVEFTLEAPPTVNPQLLRAYMLSIHPASNTELASLLRGYPNYG